MEKETNYLNIQPSASHLCDIARERLRAENSAMQDAVRSRDRLTAQRPFDMAKAVQTQARYVFHHRIAELMRQIMEESCGL